MAFFIRQIGIRRCGNHGFTNWLLGHFMQHRFDVNYFNNSNDDVVMALASYAKTFIPTEFDFHQSKKVILVSVEDCSPEMCSPLPPIFQNTCNCFNILILRDPFNMYASRLKGSPSNDWKTHPLAANLYLANAYEMLGKTSFLTDKTIFVNYNKWISEKKYRKSIIDNFGLLFTDVNFLEIKDSSFPENNNLMERWKFYAQDPQYLKWVSDPRIQEVSKNIFDFIPDLPPLQPHSKPQ